MIKVNWDMIDKQYNYVAMDANGFWYSFINRPVICENDFVWKDVSLSWEIPNDDAITFNHTEDVKDWKQTLVCRSKQDKDNTEFTEENFIKYINSINFDNARELSGVLFNFKQYIKSGKKSSEELAVIELLKSLNYNVEKL